MKTYLRRLGYALIGKQYTPLTMGAKVAFRSPAGTLLNYDITSVSYHQELDRQSRLVIEAQPPHYRLTVGSRQ